LDQVRADLPDAMVQWGRHPVANRYALGPDGACAPAGQVCRSWLGAETRLSAEDRLSAGPPLAGAVELALSDGAVHQERVSINAAIARRGDAAIRTRLQRHCPIPPDQAEIAYRLAGPDGPDRVVVEIAIARKHDVDAARQVAGELGPDWTVVAGGAAGSVFALASSEASGTAQGWRSPVLRFGLVVLAGLALLAALGARFDRQAEALDARRDQLVGQTRQVREARDARALAEPALQAREGYASLPELLEALAQLPGREESAGGLSRIDLQPPDALRVLPTSPQRGTASLTFSEPSDAEGAQ
jgi:hypothetical protein